MTTKTSRSTVPKTDAERATCIAAIATLDLSSIDTTIASYVRTDYSLALDAFATTRVDSEAAALKVALDSDRVRKGSTAFDSALRSWGLGLDGTAGRRFATGLVSSSLGNRSLSDFEHLSPRRKADGMVPALARIASDPRLAGDAGRLDALKGATTELGAAVDGWEESLRLRAVAVAAHVAATRRFDSSYGVVVRLLRSVDPDRAASTLPIFVRTRSGSAPPAAAAPAPTPSVDPPTEPSDPPTS